MQAVILAGGEGARLRPLTATIPKPMMPVLNRPFLEHALQRLRQHAITEVFLALGYLPGAIEQHFGDGTRVGVSLHYSQEPTPLGTAGAVKLIENRLLGTTFLVCNGDIFTDLDISQMLAFHRQRRSKATIFLTYVNNPTAFGVVETDGEGRVRRFVEKPAPEEVTSNWINGGMYLLEPEVLQEVPTGSPFMFERGLFPRLLEQGVPVYGYQARPYWLDMGTPQSYLKLHRDLLLGSTPVSFLAGDPPDRVWRERGCRVAPGAVVQGPVLLGEECTVEAGAIVRGPAVLGPRCRIGADATVMDSVIWGESTVGAGSVVEGCIVGRGVQLGPQVHLGRDSMVADGAIVGKGNRLEPGSSLGPGEELLPTKVASDRRPRGRA